MSELEDAAVRGRGSNNIGRMKVQADCARLSKEYRFLGTVPYLSSSMQCYVSNAAKTI
jgi:hypothetical protein